ncbi:PIN domain-containing protein [Streptomyces sp. DSM 44917]|uniref:PIN domain-containing protein n=1 Tax=Streptomyces boetiae TaxID=3075541 RepID=A0ABU2LDS7_9ACTN|nr:PIN domain-containing protein [Streptomyces sp. DSM 44917]MDT0309657.1 PIN domain-containing protein [Streptomyces sp. DSM 44917]
MSELAPSGRRTLYQRGPLRRALLDTSVLTTDIIAATRRPAPSSFVAGARAGTVRCLIPVHVWEEVPRVLADRHHEGGRFDLGRALELWQSRYAPVLYVVDTSGLPMTPQAQVLAGRDASDVPMLLLAGAIAPVVIIGTDADLVDSGLAVGDWVALRTALGDVGVTEGRMADLERQASVLLNFTGKAIWGAVRFSSNPKRLAAGAVVGTVVIGTQYWRQRKRPRVPSQRKPVLPVVLEHFSTRMAALTERHIRGEDRWRQAELGTPGDTLLHRVARTLVGSREPLTRTAIVERLGEAVPGARHTGRMATVLEVLTAHPMFVDVTGRGHWQVGRLGGR